MGLFKYGMQVYAYFSFDGPFTKLLCKRFESEACRIV
jgi:hypothetical protein